MDVSGLLIAGAGVVLAVLVVIDVFLTVLHVDTDGPVAAYAIETAAEVVMASGLAAGGPRYRGIRPIAMELSQVVTETMKLIGRQHLDEETRNLIERPSAGPEDEATLARLERSLRDHIAGLEDRSQEYEPSLLELAARTRILLEALDELTAWRMDLERLPPVLDDA